MIVDLRTISLGPLTYEYILERDWWRLEEFEDHLLGLDSPLDVRLGISPAGDKFILEGTLRGGVLVRCDRCLGSYHRDLNAVFRIFLALPLPENDETEMEILEEDMAIDFIRGEKIDLDEIVREQIYLSLPMKLLCREDCKGLCPKCGTNLNKGPCQCRHEVGHPGFSALKNLKIQ